MEPSDATEFKSRDAASYDLVTDKFDHYTSLLTNPLAERLLELTNINRSEDILDIGTGTGVVALQAANIVGTKGKIYGIDLSAEMLSIAKKKAANRELDQRITFARMDAEELSFEDNSFDSVVSLFALLHFPNPLAALKEIKRVLRPGGKLVLAIGSGVSIFSLTGLSHILKKLPDYLRQYQGKLLVAPHYLDSLTDELTVEFRTSEESHLAGHTHLNRPKEVISLVRKAGFDVVKTDWMGRQEIIEDPLDFWDIQRTFSSISRKRLNEANHQDVESLKKKFIAECREVQSKGGKLSYPFGAFYIVASNK